MACLLTRRGLNKVAHDISNASKRGASDVNSAVAAVEAALRIDASAYDVRSQVLFVYAIAGRWKEVDEQSRLALAEGQNSPHFMKAAISIVHGDIDRAMAAT